VRREFDTIVGLRFETYGEPNPGCSLRLPHAAEIAGLHLRSSHNASPGTVVTWDYLWEPWKTRHRAAKPKLMMPALRPPLLLL